MWVFFLSSLFALAEVKDAVQRPVLRSSGRSRLAIASATEPTAVRMEQDMVHRFGPLQMKRLIFKYSETGEIYKMKSKTTALKGKWHILGPNSKFVPGLSRIRRRSSTGFENKRKSTVNISCAAIVKKEAENLISMWKKQFLDKRNQGMTVFLISLLGLSAAFHCYAVYKILSMAQKIKELLPRPEESKKSASLSADHGTQPSTNISNRRKSNQTPMSSSQTKTMQPSNATDGTPTDQTASTQVSPSTGNPPTASTESRGCSSNKTELHIPVRVIPSAPHRYSIKGTLQSTAPQPPKKPLSKTLRYIRPKDTDAKPRPPQIKRSQGRIARRLDGTSYLSLMLPQSFTVNEDLPFRRFVCFCQLFADIEFSASFFERFL